MKESVNTAIIFNIILVFFVIIIVLLTTSLSYSKAFKVKNRIIEIIELHQDYNPAAKTEINEFLRDIGYKTNDWRVTRGCRADRGTALSTSIGGYRYCIYRNEVYNGTYYVVEAFIYFDFPVINSLIEIPVYGETKILYDLDEI